MLEGIINKYMDLKSFLFDNGIVKEEVPVDFFIHPKFLWLGLGVILLLFAIVSLILVYHWITYGYKLMATTFMGAVYFSVSFVIFSVILITLLGYSATLL